MPDPVTTLAMTGASTIVAAMATDAWQAARSAIVRLFSKGGGSLGEASRDRLDRAAAEVEAADLADRDAIRERLLSMWQVRLADLLEEYPDAGGELRRVIDDLRGRLPRAQQTWVQQVTAAGQGSVAQGVMFGNIINHSLRTDGSAGSQGHDCA